MVTPFLDNLNSLMFLNMVNYQLSWICGFYSVINAANLGGELGDNLGLFTSISTM
jgi:predicted double-glycine peptidase